MSFQDITDSVGNLLQRITSIDDRYDFACFDKLFQMPSLPQGNPLPLGIDETTMCPSRLCRVKQFLPANIRTFAAYKLDIVLVSSSGCDFRSSKSSLHGGVLFKRPISHPGR